MTKYLSVLPNQLESIDNHMTKKHLQMIQAFWSNLGKDP